MKRKPHRTTNGAPRGWTLIELLMAVAVASAFLLGVFAAFVQILRTSDRSERRIEAYENARAAVETIALYVKAARIEPSLLYQYFQGLNLPILTGLRGDRVDNDGDGRIDEEQPNGRDDDGDFVVARDDRHVRIGTIVERGLFVGQPDLGDDRVDEDVIFHHDQLSLAIFPDPSVLGSRNELTSFSIGTWEGENYVLLQQTLRDIGSGTAWPQVGPLAYNVLSLNFLYWDPNRSPPYWVEAWDAMTTAPQPDRIELPAAVHISVTVYAGRVPLDQLGPNEPIETVTASTVVAVEAVIHDPRYELLVRPNQ